LVKKLVRPLTKLIQETTAMSLLYECISGIIQGGILDGADSGVDVEEVADLCISKLRGMIVVDGDPNLKYVALLAFNKIVGSHPMLVSMQQDVIMACLDDPDISIKMQALELVSGMVNSDNLQSVVNRLMKQLANSPSGSEANGHVEEGHTDMEQRLIPDKRGSEHAPLSEEYRREILSRILDMCSHNTYANVTDFEWYIEILVHLVRHLPGDQDAAATSRASSGDGGLSLGSRVGNQLQDIAVRVKDLRPETTKAAETLVLLSNRAIVFPRHGLGQSEVLRSTAWVCGEFAEHLSNPYEVLNSLIHESSHNFAPATIAIFIQAIPKVIVHIAITANREWNVSRRSTMSLFLARAIEFLDTLSSHPNLEVQERSVEFLELLRLASDALSNQANDSVQAPLFLTSAIPSLFSGVELNPVSAAAQKKVPLPDDLDLDAPINPDLPSILQTSQIADADDSSHDVFHAFYHDREPTPTATTLQPQTAASAAYAESAASETEPLSYQAAPESPQTLARRKAERMARNRDDPFYIAPSDDETGPHFHEIISRSNGEDELDVDSIPIIDLHIDHTQTTATNSGGGGGDDRQDRARTTTARRKKPIRKFVVAKDETLDGEEAERASPLSPLSQSVSTTPTLHTLQHPHQHPSQQQHYRPRSLSPNALLGHRHMPGRPRPGLLTVDSSTLERLALEGPPETESDILRREAEEAEMAIALREVQQKRLEMQREAERARTVMAEGVDAEGTVVRRKKKKRATVTAAAGEIAEEEEGRPQEEHDRPAEGDVVKKKKKKTKSPASTSTSAKKKKVKARPADEEKSNEGNEMGGD
jgi:AP-3 complex subunit delta-1